MTEVRFDTIDKSSKIEIEDVNKKLTQNRMENLAKHSLKDESIKRIMKFLFAFVYLLFSAFYIRTYKQAIEKIYDNEGVVALFKSQVYWCMQRDLLIICTCYILLQWSLSKIMHIPRGN